jgi:hypothetical protein
VTHTNRERERERERKRERDIPPSNAFVGCEFYDGIFEIIHHNFELFDVFVIFAHGLLPQFHKSQYPGIFTIQSHYIEAF